MTSPNPSVDEDNPPATPKRAGEAKRRASHGANPTTPIRKASAGVTPRTAPGRPRAATTKQPPTLLNDFLLGRPSAGRMEASKQAAKERRKSLEVVKQEMRRAAVARVPLPGGVKDRVKNWQKQNASAMASADPLATPSEPSEVHIQVDEESVTEEDRVRIKTRQRRKPVVVVEQVISNGDETEKENQSGNESRPNSPPKKRVVSDTNWMKEKKKKSPPRNRSPKASPNGNSQGSPLPKNFLSKPTPNPPVSKKIRDWAARVEIPDEPAKRPSPSRQTTTSDGIRVKSAPFEGDSGSSRSGGSHIVVETESRPKKPKAPLDDGIRVTPQRKKAYYDDGIRVKAGSTSKLPDDGIRVYSDTTPSRDSSKARGSSKKQPRKPSTEVTGTTETTEDDKIVVEVYDDSETEIPDTPTRRSSKRTVKNRRSVSRKSAPARSQAETGTSITEDVSDSGSWSDETGSDLESDLPSSMPTGSLADIPVGYSAFSELNLPNGPNTVRRPRAERTSSFKGAKNVLKRALNEGKKIISEKVDPPKPVVNQPPSIESWLKNTVDPFVDSKATDSPDSKKKSTDESTGRRSASLSKRRSLETATATETIVTEDTIGPSEITATELSDEKSEEPQTPPTPSSLKRRSATRSTSSPFKTGAKKGFKERLKDAFRGESSGHKGLPMEYPNGSEVEIEEYVEVETPRRRSPSASKSPPRDEFVPEDDQELPDVLPLFPKRRPPTNGFHELSTIVSEESLTTHQMDDASSVISQTTVTETTGLTKETDLTRTKSHKSGGLKRRLTKHSDLVSVLSLPEDGATLGRSSSRRSRTSLHRSSSRLGSATVESLFQEFVDDENFYQRELKTLVDGVIPVLLTQVVNGDGSSARDFFDSPSGKKKDSMGRAVVNMGIALEKLRNAHRRCPLSNVHQLPQWLEGVTAIYDAYLDAWRLGFSDLIVNLAHASMDDDDSLVNAMPRNEQGDVLNEDGERVDVAHLLKRPLVRIKWIAKFIKGYRTISGTEDHKVLAENWETLQEKARRRHKEENARATDEDAANTDTSRVRSLQTLSSVENVKIDRFRQVYAKDLFSLDLRHSNGQRLGCQVELISRDNQLFKSDPGDLLVRETGSQGRSWLLFEPILGGQYSARQGDEVGQLVLMIRGKNDEWFELLTLITDNDEQVFDWIDILGVTPVPPEVIKSESTQSLVHVPAADLEDIPLGEKKHRDAEIDSPGTPKTPSRYHGRRMSTTTPITSPTQTSASAERTPTQDHHRLHPLPTTPKHGSPEDGYSRPLRESMRPDPLKLSPNAAPVREDGAPPPPAHRTLNSKKSPGLSPPVTLTPSGLKRRTSSPLKHEYHPSDVSSNSSTSVTDSDEDSDSGIESSDDELEAEDMPDAMPAISIKKHTETVVESVVSGSTVSLTPSASASQANIPRYAGKPPAYLLKSLASISYWDNKKGCWKDLWPDLCSVVITPGLIEAYPHRRTHTSSHTPETQEEHPLIAMDLTPLVMLRNSTVLDLEIRSPVLQYARLYPKISELGSNFFRFRAPSMQECHDLYSAVHRARMDNAKYKALEEEARVRAFGQNQMAEAQDDGNSSRRRSWFGRKNSYRASARAPSQTAGSSSHNSSISASTFLKKLMGNVGADGGFNIAASSVDKQSSRGSSGASTSLYGSSASGRTPPRSPSVSAASGHSKMMSLTTNNLKVRLHLLVSASKWEDHGNCLLEITRPDTGTKQNLRKYQGMEKRIVVMSIPRKETDKTTCKLDVVLGSRCFTRLGSRGILLNVWEEVKDESGEAGVVGSQGASGGNVSKWCFQCTSVGEAAWIYGLVTQEVMIG